MKFQYKIQTKDGKISEGVIEAPDKFALTKQFRDQGTIPLMIAEKKGALEINIPFIDALFGKIKLSEKIIFTRNLAGMLTAGLALSRALQVLHKQTKNKKFQNVIEDLMKNIDKGGTLSDGMAKYPKVFSTLFVSMVRAGEESGKLAPSLSEIGANLEKSYNLTRKVKGAMTYPAVIISAMFLIGILMMIYVVPTLTGTFKELNVELPTSTKLVIWISDTLSSSPLLVFASLIGFVFLMRAFIRAERTQPFIDIFVLKLPVVGNIIREMNSARTARTLSSLLASGVDVTRALQITKDVVQNVHYKKLLQKAVDSVQKGVPISAVFKERIDLYPVMVGEMMEVGEETGKFGDMLLEIATFYEDEVEAKTKDLSTIVEPVLMILIGGAVGFFAVSMITPMYSLMDTIS